MNSKLYKIFATATALLTTASGLAFADINVGSQLGKTETEITESLQQQGATVEEFELDDDMIEVEYSINGAEFEVKIDPATGTVATLKNEEESDDDEGRSDTESDDDDDDEKESG